MIFDTLHMTYMVLNGHFVNHPALNVVVMLKTNLKIQDWTHGILFNSVLALFYDQLIDFYSLCFQIESSTNLLIWTTVPLFQL
jgi:hypothetical protein